MEFPFSRNHLITLIALKAHLRAMVEQCSLVQRETPSRYPAGRTILTGMLVTFLVGFLVAGTAVQAVEQAPSMPHVFFGEVTVSDQPVPAGLQVEARGAGVRTGIRGNPVTTGNDGMYGGPGSYDHKLVVQGEIAQNTPIEFYVNGVQAECFDVAANTVWTDSYPWSATGLTELNLRVASLPDTFVTTEPTTLVTTSTTTVPVTTTVTTYRTSAATGGGGGGGFYSGSVASVTTVMTTSITPTQTIVPTESITEYSTSAVNSTEAVTGTQTLSGEPTQESNKTGGAFPIPVNPFIGIIAVMVIIGVLGRKFDKRK